MRNVLTSYVKNVSKIKQSKEFGAVINAAIEEVGLKKKDVAEKAGIDLVSLSRIINNVHGAAYDTAVNIIDAINNLANRTVLDKEKTLNSHGYSQTDPKDTFQIGTGLRINFTGSIFNEEQKREILRIFRLVTFGLQNMPDDEKRNKNEPMRAEDNPELAKRKGYFPSGKNRNS